MWGKREFAVWNVEIDVSSIPAMVPKNSSARRYRTSHGSSVSRLQCASKECPSFLFECASDGFSSDIGNSTPSTELPCKSLSSILTRGGTAFQSISIAPKFGWPDTYNNKRTNRWRSTRTTQTTAENKLNTGWKFVMQCSQFHGNSIKLQLLEEFFLWSYKY